MNNKRKGKENVTKVTDSETGIEFVMLGKESQKHIHYAMPLRVMGYDYGTYKKQYDDNAAKYTSSHGMDADEYLSRMKRIDRFSPVVTVVVYYSEKPWDGATTLHEMLHIPEEFAAYVNNYKMLLVEARKYNFTFHNIDNIDFFRLMEIILNGQISRKEAKKQAICVLYLRKLQKKANRKARLKAKLKKL